jgi:hypothetical protein
MNETFQFAPLSVPLPWQGRYARIPGQESAFHAKDEGVAIVWYDKIAGERLTACITPSPAANSLIEAVDAVKMHFAGRPGGSFQVNEFGDVICPVSNSRERYLVGRITGVPTFYDPRQTGQRFSLMAPPKTTPGSLWEWPYLGMAFNLGADDRIYFQRDDDDGSQRLYPRAQDSILIKNLRSVRPSGQTIRFVVNLHGVALTKCEPDWNPVFAGFIRPTHWFT